MEAWVDRALKRWPNVPALYGWLKLDRRGRWLIQGETISRLQIIDTINRNYAVDDRGCWYFQNGPQRGYMQLEYAPLVLRATSDDKLMTHTELAVEQVYEVAMDEEGALLLRTEHGPGALIDDELEWALQRMRVATKAVNESQLATALALPSGQVASVSLMWRDAQVSVIRIDARDAPAHFGFVREPQPL